ncbi:MAG: DUF3800 domain-containing protein [Candidatus Micrarchaeota archaeon]
MFVFVDESGQTNIKAGQKYLVLSFCICSNKEFANNLVYEIRDSCKKQGKPVVNKKELKYHELSRFQQEIAIGLINKKYRNFYVAYVDLGKADTKFTTGKSEERIQKLMLLSVAFNFAEKIEKKQKVVVFVDKKLTKESLLDIRHMVQDLKKSKKNVVVEEKNSHALCGLQLADLIAGAFRAKLMKTSGLLEVREDHIFECEPKENGLLTTSGKAKKNKV